MKLKAIMWLSIMILIMSMYIHSVSADIPQPVINSFTPSVGWAGTQDNPESGTLVTIKGTGFDPVPDNNEVRFSDSSGFPNIDAKVKWVITEGTKYNTESKTIGGPGTGLGQFKDPLELAIDDNNGDVYVVDNILGGKNMQVFNKDGNPLRMINLSELNHPWSVALDNNYVYVSDYGDVGNSLPTGYIYVFSKNGNFVKKIRPTGTLNWGPRNLVVDKKGFIYLINQIGPNHAEIEKIDFAGNMWGEITTPGDLSEHFIYGEGLALDSSEKFVYMSDKERNSVYKFDISNNLNFIEQWNNSNNKWGFPNNLNVSRIADRYGILYVQLEDYIIKLDDSGNLINQIKLDPYDIFRNFRTIDIYKRIYTVNEDCSCIKVFSPSDNEELLAYVPYGAKTGPIGIIRKTSTEQKSDISVNKFTVLENIDPVSVVKIEATQGLQSYPFVAGKETLVWAKLNGIFGHPTLDKATIKITQPKGQSFEFPYSHLEYDINKMQTNVHFHIPTEIIQGTGQYSLEVNFERNGKLIQPAWTKNFYVFNTKGLGLLFTKFTNIPSDQWEKQDPFPWFDMSNFLYGMDTFKRVYPINPQYVGPYFASGKYLEFLNDGVQEEEKSQLDTQELKVFYGYLDTVKETRGNVVQRVIGLMDPDLQKLPANGWAIFKGAAATTFFYPSFGKIHTWGRLLSHEIGHTYGLIAENEPNFDPNDKTGGHSKNKALTQEFGAPITAWNSMTDKLLDGKDAYSIMAQGVGAGDDQSFFESEESVQHPLDYWHLFEQFKDTGTLIGGAFLESQSSSHKFVILGSINTTGKVSIDQSFLTTSEINITPSQESVYSLVFLDKFGQIISQDNFSVSFTMQDGGPTDNGIFNLVVSYPDSTAKVEIRLNNQVLDMLTPSANPPVVNNIIVDLSSSFPTIRWDASDLDGNQLSYDIDYSTDGGQTFVPVAIGLKDKIFTWDDSLTAGSDKAVIKIVANDGFNRGNAISNSFQLPKRKPQLAILVPSDGSNITEGSSITLRGAAFDPEDGLLSGSNLSWQLDGNINLGTGDNARIQNFPLSIPIGTISLPLAVGPHTITLSATDSDNNKVSKDIQIDIVSDTDRDGFSDDLEKELGTDPYNPLDVPIGSISGMKFDDLNGNGKKDPGEIGISDWIITLKKPDGTSANTSTDSNGNYTFDDLLIGTYTVEEAHQSGYIQTFPIAPEAYKIDIKARSKEVNKDFGNFKLGKIDGQKFEDLNANGTKDPREVGLAGWQINLTGKDTIENVDVSRTTITDTNGRYNFTGLMAGNYTISETLQKGWIQTTPSTGNYVVSITSGAVIAGQDFGNFHKGDITGGGWISITGDPKATFGITGQYPNSSNTAKGNVEYQDHKTNLNIKSIQIKTVSTTYDKKKGAITGLAQVNGAGSYPFEIYVEDNGEPGKGKDVFKISLPTYPYSNEAVLSGGNIQIHS